MSGYLDTLVRSLPALCEWNLRLSLCMAVWRCCACEGVDCGMYSDEVATCTVSWHDKDTK